MKRLLSHMLAGAIGGGLVVFSQFYFQEAIYPNPQNQFAKSVSHINVSPSSVTPLRFTHAAAMAMPAVVHISAFEQPGRVADDENRDIFDFFLNEDYFSNPFKSKKPRKGSGSGVIYSSDGYIITNKHVVDFAARIKVTLFDNRTFDAEIIGVDDPSDLAVLKIDAQELPTLQIANSSQAQVGEWVLAVGNPFDLTSTVTAGIISAKGRSINVFKEHSSIETFIQTDAAVNPGNSGGALVNVEGHLLGINTAIATHNGVFSGYSFAIPVDLVIRIVDDIIEYGSYQRGYLGVHIYELEGENVKELGIRSTQGVVIETVTEGGAAALAGLLPNDVIVKVNGKKIRGIPDLQEVVGTAKVGEKLSITVDRKGNYYEVAVVLKPEG